MFDLIEEEDSKKDNKHINNLEKKICLLKF